MFDILATTRRQLSPAEAMMDAFFKGLSMAGAPVDPMANNYEFVMRYKPKVEGKRVQFDDWEHLKELYEDTSRFLVLMAGAQTGKTALEFTHMTRNMFVEYGSLFGYYVPTNDLARTVSDQRFGPYLRTMDEIRPLLGQATDQVGGVNATQKKSLGNSTVLFLTSKGSASTESVPLAAIYLDEVRRMDRSSIERIQERYSAQANPIDVKVSTAGYPNTSIHTYFLQGNQKHFHTDTDHPDGYVLSRNFPECIMDLRTATPAMIRKVEHAFANAGRPMCNMTEDQRKQYPLACYQDHRTGKIITNPREGWWQADRPSAYIASYQMPQMLSPMWNAGRVLDKFERNEDRQEFHNSMLGLPYIDEERRPVKDEHLAACINGELIWPANESYHWRKRHVRNATMGVDCQAGYLIAVIKTLTPNGRGRILHVEVVYEGSPKRVGDNPWKRLAELMSEYDVRICVIDGMPHTNEALRFATAFRGRVWLATYTGGNSGMISWCDIATKKRKKGVSADIASRFRVLIHRTRGLQWSLGRWPLRMNEVPPPDRLWQPLPVRSDGRVELSARLQGNDWRPVAVARDVFFWHQKCVMFENAIAPTDKVKLGTAKVEASAVGKEKIEAVHVEIDPHFAHANLYCDVALDRMVNGQRDDGLTEGDDE